MSSKSRYKNNFLHNNFFYYYVNYFFSHIFKEVRKLKDGYFPTRVKLRQVSKAIRPKFIC